MLTFGRKTGEGFVLYHPDGGQYVVTVTKIKGGKCRVAVDAPIAIKVLRSELIIDRDPPPAVR